jgi:hypothetical protein
MEYYCPSCQKEVNDEFGMCDTSKDWFYSLQGQKIWRIRFLNRFAYQFLSEQQYQAMMEEKPLILSDASYWEQFDLDTLTGVNSHGVRTSIFE